VTIDFSDPPEAWASLGHDYRVVVHVTTWSAPDALTVPVSALFRKGDQWAVFADENGRAKTVPVNIGHRNNRMAEVLSGLAAEGSGRAAPKRQDCGWRQNRAPGCALTCGPTAVARHRLEVG